MPLSCEKPSWFTGSFGDTQFFNPAMPAAANVAMAMALMTAAGKAAEKIDKLNGMPCPAKCSGKTALYALEIGFQFSKRSVKCTVGWLLWISCDPEVTKDSLNLEDWKKLHRRYADVK